MFGVLIFEPWNPTSLQPKSSTTTSKICKGAAFTWSANNSNSAVKIRKYFNRILYSLVMRRSRKNSLMWLRLNVIDCRLLSRSTIDYPICWHDARFWPALTCGKSVKNWSRTPKQSRQCDCRHRHDRHVRRTCLTRCLGPKENMYSQVTFFFKSSQFLFNSHKISFTKGLR